MQTKVLNIPNILSIIRIILAVVFAVLLYNFYKLPAAGVFLLAILTDLADGYIARTYNQITMLGKILDPAADRLLMLTAFVILFLRYDLPLGLTIFILGYHAFLIGGWLVIFLTKKIAVEHSFWGKLNSFLQTLMFLAVIFNFYPHIFFVIIIISITIAMLGYLRRGWIAFKNRTA